MLNNEDFIVKNDNAEDDSIFLIAPDKDSHRNDETEKIRAAHSNVEPQFISTAKDNISINATSRIEDNINYDNLEEIQAIQVIDKKAELPILNYKTAYWDIIKISAPFSINNYAIAFDKYLKILMIANLGPPSLAATSIAFTIKNVITGLEGSILRPLSPMFAQNVSKKKFITAGSILQSAWLIGTLESIPMVLLLSFSKPIIKKLWSNQELAPIASSYLLPFSFGLVLERWRDADIAFLSSIGKERSTLLFTLVPKGIGLLTAFGLILGKLGLPRLGLAGAAYAGLVEALTSNIMLKAYLFKGKGFKKYKIFNFKLRNVLIQAKTILKLGAPSMVFSAVQFPIDIIQNVMLSWLGSSRLVLDQIVWQNLSYTGPIINAITQATSISVARSAGDENFVNLHRYSRAGLVINIGLSSLAAVALTAFSDPLFNIFYSNQDSFDLSSSTIRIAFLLANLNAILIATSSNTIGNLRAIYDVYFPTGIEIANAFFVTLPLCYLFSEILDFDIFGLYTAQLIGRMILNIAWGARWHNRTAKLESMEELTVVHENRIQLEEITDNDQAVTHESSIRSEEVTDNNEPITEVRNIVNNGNNTGRWIQRISLFNSRREIDYRRQQRDENTNRIELSSEEETIEANRNFGRNLGSSAHL